MRIKQMTHWCLKDMKNGFLAFFACYLAIMLLVMLFVGVATSGTINFGLGSATIFIAVTGIVSFSMDLRVGLANGVSRRSVFCSLAICTVILGAATALAELLLLLLATVLGDKFSINLQLLENTAGGRLDMQVWLENLGLQVSMQIMAMAVGLAIGGAYYRMSRIVKIFVSILVPLLLLVGIPSFAVAFPVAAGAVMQAILVPAFQFVTAAWWSGALSALSAAAVFLFCTWLLMRRAPAIAVK